jgi:BlaI family transcriptional regulator, penicillinase repressor
MQDSARLSGQQHRIMRILWRAGEASARQVQEALNGALAHTTVGTMLARLEKKGVLSSTTKARERVYRPLVSESDVRRSMVADLVTTIFKGDPKALVAHLVRENEIEPGDLKAIRELMQEHEA